MEQEAARTRRETPRREATGGQPRFLGDVRLAERQALALTAILRSPAQGLPPSTVEELARQAREQRRQTRQVDTKALTMG